MCHLETRSLESALDVEPLVGLTAVQDALVATDVCGNEIEGLDDFESELLALLVLGYRYILDVSDETEVVDARMRQWVFTSRNLGHLQLPLHDQCAGSDDPSMVLDD